VHPTWLAICMRAMMESKMFSQCSHKNIQLTHHVKAGMEKVIYPLNCSVI
jgi:hypothetical protein